MKQCATCENEFDTPTDDNACPICGSGNWVNGNIDLPEPGCVFDNHRGIYMGEAIIELAESYGMPHENDRTPDDEFYWEAVDDAENYLNKNVAEEGHCFGFGPCGDFMYMPISWWADE